MYGVIKNLFVFLNCISFHYAVGQQIESNSNRERNFAFEVKHIDELFERFNNEDDAFIVKYLKENFNNITISRRSLINNLFNREKDNWNLNEADNFLNEVTDTLKPVYLDFYSENWYAEALCRVDYNGRAIDVVVVLKIQTAANGGSKWVILSAHSRRIVSNETIKFRGNASHTKFINPMSHATNFNSLSRALNDKSNIRDYIDNIFWQSSSSRDFLTALLKNRLRFQYVKRIKYHFLNVDNWIFTVERFQRPSVNSGWLISSLLKASDKEKVAYKNLLLGINL